jgi:two-component system, LytTR family, sensor kinase
MDPARQRRRSRLAPVIVHVIIWCGILCIPLLPDPWDNEVVGLSPVAERAIKAAILVLVLLVFYASYGILAPRYFFTKRYRTYVLFTLGVLAIALGFVVLLSTALTFADGTFTKSMLPILSALFIVFTLASLGGTGLRTIAEWRKLQSERDALALERSKSELEALRSRVDPHYLFNSLNTIYALAHRRDPRTEGAVLQLSTLMRYVLTVGGKDRVSLEQEFEHLKAFIEFQRLRSTAHVQVELEIRGELSGVMIDPLLLQPLVENAFKHGVSAHELSPIQVEAIMDNGMLRFQVTNRINRQPAQDHSSGTGLGNVRRRLELKYPGKHLLRIRSEEDIHHVDLTIDLT